MAEDPATWDEAEKVIADALDQAKEGHRLGMVGWSTPKQIAEALRKVDLLRVRAQAADAYAQQNADWHRENLRLLDENSDLRARVRELEEQIWDLRSSK